MQSSRFIIVAVCVLRPVVPFLLARVTTPASCRSHTQVAKSRRPISLTPSARCLLLRGNVGRGLVMMALKAAIEIPSPWVRPP